MPELQSVLVEVSGGVAVITLNRPPVNALSRAVFDALGKAAEQISEDETVRVAILTAAGRYFCAGADVKELATHGPSERASFFELTNATRRKVTAIPVPVIAALNGPAAGAGVAYATFCDYRIAVEEAFMAMPEINLGSVAAGGLPLMAIGVPSGALRYMLFSGRRVPAREAMAMHLVDEVVPSGRLMEVARDRAAALAEKSRPALIAMKRAIGEMSWNPTWNEEAYRRTQQMTIDLIGRPKADGEA